ncbi:MAG: glycosyltransferase [Pseudomonadota bacterium]
MTPPVHPPSSFPAQAYLSLSETKPRHIQIDGPFTGSYSLSMVNREMAMALEALNPNAVSICFNCRAHWKPEEDPEYLRCHPEVNRLYRRSMEETQPDVVLYNSYPPIVSTVPGALVLTNSYGWEESLFPLEYVRGFNDHLAGVTVMSSYVLKTLQDNGVGLPMAVVGLGVDHIQRITAAPHAGELGDGFRFLHVSSCFPRKGLDVLLEAYGMAFTSRDDVTLIIKTFPNPHNRASAMTKAFLKKADAPGVILIDEDIDESELLDIYQRSDCLVAPSRGEGFGLPMAEAMALKIPVITTGFGGQTDFCTPETAWLIDYTFQKAKTHLSSFGSVWAEPDAHHLAHLMRTLFEADPARIHLKTLAAHARITSRYTWKAAAERLTGFLSGLGEKNVDHNRRIRTGLVSTWNSRCGIAEYSRYLLPFLLGDLEVAVLAPDYTERMFPDEPNVRRVWNHADCHRRIPEAVRSLSLECVIINFHFGFFPLPLFRELLETLLADNIKVLIIFHATRGGSTGLAPIADTLKKVHRLLVHAVEDLNRFKEMGLSENISLFPHGVAVREAPARPAAVVLPRAFRTRRIIASFGFLMPHKGTLELINAFSILHEKDPGLGLLLLTSLYPKEEVRLHFEECLSAIDGLGLGDVVHLIPEFLPLEDVLALLQKASLIVFPYQHTAESSSAAVRMGLGADRPVACTPLPIFADVEGAVHFLPGFDPVSLAGGMAELLSAEGRLNAKNDARRQWLSVHGWPRVGKRLAGLVRALTFENLSHT